MTPAQCRAARALLSWTQADLARQAEVHINTVRHFEVDDARLRETTLERMRDAFETAGVVFDLEAGRGLGLRFKEDSREAENIEAEDTVAADKPLSPAMMIAIAASDDDDLSDDEQDALLETALNEALDLDPSHETCSLAHHPTPSDRARHAIEPMEAEIECDRKQQNRERRWTARCDPQDPGRST